jgi:hypothetical protein
MRYLGSGGFDWEKNALVHGGWSRIQGFMQVGSEGKPYHGSYSPALFENKREKSGDGPVVVL